MPTESNKLRKYSTGILIAICLLSAPMLYSVIAPFCDDQASSTISDAEQEDKRAAVNFSVDLSSQLITAALALLAVEAAFFTGFSTYTHKTYGKIGASAAIAGSISAVSIFASIWCAGKGITAVRDAGFMGDWSLDAGRPFFNAQAGLAFWAIITFFTMLLLSAIEARRFQHNSRETAAPTKT